MNNSAALADLLVSLEMLNGPPPGNSSEQFFAVWKIACGDYTEEQIAKATKPMLTRKTYGWPKPSDLAEIIEGKTIKVPEYATDLGGARFREKPGGPLVVDRWHEIRVPHDWEGTPMDLDWWTLTPQIKTFHAELEAAKALMLGEGSPA